MFQKLSFLFTIIIKLCLIDSENVKNPLKFSQIDTLIEEILTYSKTNSRFIIALLEAIITTITISISIHAKRIFDYAIAGEFFASSFLFFFVNFFFQFFWIFFSKFWIFFPNFWIFFSNIWIFFKVLDLFFFKFLNCFCFKVLYFFNFLDFLKFLDFFLKFLDFF